MTIEIHFETSLISPHQVLMFLGILDATLYISSQ